MVLMSPQVCTGQGRERVEKGLEVMKRILMGVLKLEV